MKVNVFTLFLIFILKTSAFAQQEKPPSQTYLGLGIGVSLDRLNDTNLSPLNQQGTALFYRILYERHSRNILKFDIKYGDGILKSGRKNRLETSYYKGSIGATYLKNLSTNNSTTNVYIGGTYKLDILYMDWYDQDAFSYISTHGLSLDASISQKLTTNQLVQSTISVPVAQYLSRPPYNGIDEYIKENQDDPINIIFNGRLTSLKAYKSINWNINYNYQPSNHLNLRLDYDLNIQKAKTISEFKSLSNRISTSILYKF